MARFQRTARVYRIEFGEGNEFEGLIVKVNGATVAEVMPALTDDKAIMELFAGHLVEWNLDDENGDPVPVTRDAVMGQDLRMIFSVAYAWIRQMLVAVRPKARQPTNGEVPDMGALADMTMQVGA